MKTTLFLFLILAVSPANAGRGQQDDWIEVPGGRAAIGRIVGFVDQEPDRLITSLNRKLLKGLVPDAAWESVAARRLVSAYIEHVRSLEKEFSNRIEVSIHPGEGRDRFRRLIEEFGYEGRPEGPGDRLSMLPQDGEEAKARRWFARALDWNLTAIAEGLTVDTVVLTIESERVPSPISFDDWKSIVGGDITSATALRQLVRDQSMGLVLEGRRRMTTETIDALGDRFWKWAYNGCPMALYRIASSLTVVFGQVVTPGGVATAPNWSRMVGVHPSEPEAFLNRLLIDDGVSQLWQGLSVLPNPAARFYVDLLFGVGGASDGGSGPDWSAVCKPRARSRIFGFASLVRSIDLEMPDRAPANRRPNLVEQNRLELALDALSGKRTRGGVAGGENRRQKLMIEFLTGSGPEGGGARGVRRLIRTINTFPEATPLFAKTVNEIAAATLLGEPALRVLDSFTPSTSDSVVQYLQTLNRVDDAWSQPPSELVLTNFSAGVEWLRLFARAGSVSPERLSAALESWARIHANAAGQRLVAARQLRWLAELVDGLPDPGKGAPGRAPSERALLAAMTGGASAEFSWRGLDFESRGSRVLAAEMARRMRRQGIPAIDYLLALSGLVDRLRGAGPTRDIAALRPIAVMLRDTVRKPTRRDRIALTNLGDLPPDLLPDRVALARTANRLVSAADGQSVPAFTGELDRFTLLLARELRVVLLAPPYLLAVGVRDNVLLDDPDLISKHRFFRGRTAGGDRVRLPAHMAYGRVAGTETYAVGELSGITGALAEFHLRGTGHADAPLHGRDALWQQAAGDSSLRFLSADLTRLAALLVAGGRELRAAAMNDLETDGDHARFLASRIPRARLEADSRTGDGSPLLSPSELFSIGLAALDGDSVGGRRTRLLSDEIVGEFDEIVSLIGEDWRKQLDGIGSVTPRLNGRQHPWVGTWVAYEGLEHERPPAALLEREFFDLAIVVVDFLGRHGLPGSVGADLMVDILVRASSSVRLEDASDWEGHIRWVWSLEDDFLVERTDACLRAGLYSLR